MKPLLRPNQVAEILGCDRATVYRMMAAGELAFIPTRAGRRVRQEDVEAYQDSLRVAAARERAPSRRAGLPGYTDRDETAEGLRLADQLGLKY